jgi:hypothetical protein
VARVAVAAQTTPGAYPTLQPGAGTRDISFQAYDAGLGCQATIVDGKTLILVKNDHVSDAKTVTFLSVADSVYKRTGDITAYSLAAGDVALFGPFKTAGWALVGQLQIDASSADIKLANITLP